MRDGRHLLTLDARLRLRRHMMPITDARGEAMAKKAASAAISTIDLRLMLPQAEAPHGHYRRLPPFSYHHHYGRYAHFPRLSAAAVEDARQAVISPMRAL